MVLVGGGVGWEWWEKWCRGQMWGSWKGDYVSRGS